MRLTGLRATAFAPELPFPYRTLAEAGVHLRRGELSLTAAAPTVGKSQFWLNVALRMGVPSLYWSADMPPEDVTTRTLAMHLNLPVTAVRENLPKERDREWMFEQLGGRSDHIEWVFDPVVTIQAAEERLEAFAELHGEYPHLFVVDNVRNAIDDKASEYAETDEILSGLQVLGRESKAHTAALTHVKGAYEDGHKPVPMSGPIQNAFKRPTLGLTMHRPQDTLWYLGVNVVKTREGVSDTAAERPVFLSIDYSKSQVLVREN